MTRPARWSGNDRGLCFGFAQRLASDANRILGHLAGHATRSVAPTGTRAATGQTDAMQTDRSPTRLLRTDPRRTDPRRGRFGWLALAALLLPAVPAQAPPSANEPPAIALPEATGSLHPTAAWSIRAPNRTPADDEATDLHPQLRAILAELRNRDDGGAHLLLHQSGSAPDSIRIVHAYSDAVGTDVDALFDASATAKMQAALLDAFGAGTRFVAQQRLDLFTIDSLCMRLRRTAPDGGSATDIDVHVVPAGDRLQYFETHAASDDDGAKAAFAALLGSFDGAREHKSMTQAAIVGGLGGAIAGMLAAMLRRRRQLRRTLAESATEQAGRDADAG